MKYFFITLLLLVGCSFYDNKVPVIIAGLDKGKLIISSENYYEEIFLDNSNEYSYDFYKGEYYSICFYPRFNGSYSRFPLGAFVDIEKSFVTVSAKLGVLSESVMKLYEQEFKVQEEYIVKLKTKIETEEDPWIFYQDDFFLYLAGAISIGSISKKESFEIISMDIIYDLKSENPLFYCWYQSIQSFYDPISFLYYRVEVYEDGTFTWFLEL